MVGTHVLIAYSLNDLSSYSYSDLYHLGRGRPSGNHVYGSRQEPMPTAMALVHKAARGAPLALKGIKELTYGTIEWHCHLWGRGRTRE